MVEILKKYIVKIESYSHEGKGIAYIDGFVIFIPNGILNEILEIKIIKLTKNYALGKVIEIISPSNDRVMPLCDIYDKCGGCDLQHMDYKEQVSFKQKKIVDTLTKIGKLDNVNLHKFYSMSIPYEYRNKVQIPFGTIDGIAVAGFYENKSHKIMNMDFCHIQFKEANDIIVQTRAYIKKNNIKPYDEVAHSNRKQDIGFIRNLLIRKGYNTNEIMVVIVVTYYDEKILREYVDFLLSICNNIKTIVVNVNNKVTNVILGKEESVLYGDGYIKDKLFSYIFRIQSKSFFQVNTKQAEKLYQCALDMANLKYGDILLDAYCGIGTIGICASRRVKHVYGIEEVYQSIVDANQNKKLNNVKNIDFIHGKVEDSIDVLINKDIKISAVILDPPRKGVDENLLIKLRDVNCRNIVYISCDISTLARDTKILTDLGYKVVKVCGVDMFCQTHHVETIISFKR